jgi:hypothetical protein
MTEKFNPQEEMRIAIRYHTINVPGAPIDRAKRIAQDFASFKLRRSFSYNLDFIHLPPDFESNTPKWVWILCDFNVCEKIAQVEKVPIQFWKVSYNQQSS